MDASVHIACVECHGPGDLQHCLMPAPLLVKIGATVGGYVRLNLVNVDAEPCLICRTMPVMNSYGGMGHQVIACNCVWTGKTDSEFSVITGKFTMCDTQLVPLKTVNLNKVTVSVIVKSVDNVLGYRKNKLNFEVSLKRLLRLYGVVSESAISCEKNPLAKVLGINQIIVGDCSLSANEVGIITPDALVSLAGIESEDRRRLTVHQTVNLGGLDHVLSYLQRLITEPWTKREEFRKAGVVYPSGKNKNSYFIPSQMAFI